MDGATDLTKSSAASLPDLAVVRLTRDCETEGHHLPAGSLGTIVNVNAPGVSYMVEVYDGKYWVLDDVRAHQLELADKSD